MPIIKKVQTSQTVICDKCGTRKELEAGKLYKEMIVFHYTEKDGLRLFERNDRVKNYESFQIPHRQQAVFCSLDCAKKWLQHSTDLFLAEVKHKHHTITGLKRKQLN